MAPHTPGPHEDQLRRLAQADVTHLDTLIEKWRTRGDEMKLVIRALHLQATNMEEAGPTGARASASYRSFATALTSRRNGMLNVLKSLEAVRDISTVEAPAKYSELGPAPSEPTATQGETAATQQADYQTALEARETKAKQKLDFLATRYDDAAAQMGHVKPDDTAYTQDQGVGGMGPLTGSSTTGHHPGTISHTPGVIGSTPSTGVVGPGEQTPGYTPPIPSSPGTLAGLPEGSETVAPALTTTGGTPGSTPGLAAGVALGAGGIGAAAIATLGRGGTGALGAPKGVTLGGSVAKANPGTLGRGSGLLPGQSQGGRSGGAGKSGGSGDSRGGRRGNGLLNGSGVRGKDGKEKDREHDGYDDPDGWLEDDATTDAVLD